jgi:hypothetical protein
MHIHGGERVEIRVIIQGESRIHGEQETGEQETGPSKATNPRAASYSAESKTIGTNNGCGRLYSPLVCTQFTVSALGEGINYSRTEGQVTVASASLDFNY